MQKVFLLAILLIPCAYSCTNKYQKVLNNKKINSYYKNMKEFYEYKGVHLNGLYKIKVKDGYIINSFNNGMKTGSEIWYEEGNKKAEFQYCDGLLCNEAIYYKYGSHHKLKIETYAKGLPNGKQIVIKENGLDTAYVNLFETTPYKMSVYLDTENLITDLTINEISFSLNLQINTCLLTAERYPQRFYNKSDSTLIKEFIWIRTDNCYYEREDKMYNEYEISD